MEKTLILSTHKTSLLNLVDRIIIMANNQIVMDGPKQAILAQLQKNDEMVCASKHWHSSKHKTLGKSALITFTINGLRVLCHDTTLLPTHCAKYPSGTLGDLDCLTHHYLVITWAAFAKIDQVTRATGTVIASARTQENTSG